MEAKKINVQSTIDAKELAHIVRYFKAQDVVVRSASDLVRECIHLLTLSIVDTTPAPVDDDEACEILESVNISTLQVSQKRHKKAMPPQSLSKLLVANDVDEDSIRRALEKFHTADGAVKPVFNPEAAPILEEE